MKAGSEMHIPVKSVSRGRNDANGEAYTNDLERNDSMKIVRADVEHFQGLRQKHFLSPFGAEVLDNLANLSSTDPSNLEYGVAETTKQNLVIAFLIDAHTLVAKSQMTAA
jgi:hypothetical protein